jgi:fermentation-respiration switch protein FrsA (DUF1100 family)
MKPVIYETPVLIPADGLQLAGRLYRNVDDLLQPQPGIVTSGSWLTVKEQMAHRYATELAALGYTVLTFDFAGWGQSAGEPRQTEIPLRKAADIAAAARFLRSLSCVRGNEVGYVAVCASAMYAAVAIELGAPIAVLSNVAGWFHDSASVAAYYGGEAGVRARLASAQKALTRYVSSRDLVTVPAYDQGNEKAGMFIELDYYANPARGRVPAWRNEMSEMTWLNWLTFDGLRAAERIDIPTLFVHGDECALPDNVKRVHERIRAPKKLVWHPGFQVDYYDRDDLVSLSVAATHEHFASALSREQ